MKIYTKTGDKGYTALLGGKRVLKSDIRIESYGNVDELNSYIGLISDQDISPDQKSALKEIQDRLFTIGSSLATDPEKDKKGKIKTPDLLPGDIEFLEKEIDKMIVILPALRHFILPGGNTVVSFCHIARCVCRRAERSVVKLARKSEVDEQIIIYLNRLSDYLFVLGRQIAFDKKITENQWIPRV